MAKEQLTNDALEKLPVSGARSDSAGDSSRMGEDAGLSVAEMKEVTGGLLATLATGTHRPAHPRPGPGDYRASSTRS